VVDLQDAVREHFALYNDAVHLGAYNRLMANFAADAVLTLGRERYVGRAAIATGELAVLRETVELVSVEQSSPEQAHVVFRLDQTGLTGHCEMTWRGGELVEMSVSYP